MANKACMSRLQKEYKVLQKEPVPHISAHPAPTNLLEWHFVLEGDKDTDYATGVYHGKIVFPPQYPFKPPSLSLYTPNGRFATNTKLCLSMTDYHPESWNPMWSVGTILTGLLSFMHDNLPTTGSITSTSEEKRQLAADSLAYNLKNPMFRKLFPEWAEEATQRAQRAAGGEAPTTQPPNESATTGTPTTDATTIEGEQGPAAPPVARVPSVVPQQPPTVNGVQGAGGGAALGGLIALNKPRGAAPTGGVSTTVWTFAAVMVVMALAAAPLISWSSGAQHSTF